MELWLELFYTMYRLDILPFVTCLFPLARLVSHQCEQRIYSKEKSIRREEMEVGKERKNGDN